MSQQSFNGKQVNAILIQMGAEGMPERMTGESAFPAKAVLMGMDMSGKEKVSMGLSCPFCLGKRYPRGFPY